MRLDKNITSATPILFMQLYCWYRVHFKKVKEVLFLDDETLRRYVGNYRIDGIPGLLSDNRVGKACRLTDPQIELLRQELSNTI